MNKIAKASLAAFIFTTLSIAAIAQTDSTQTPPPETPAADPNASPATDPNTTPVDPNAVPSDASATPVVTDSTGAVVPSGDAPPTATSAGDKPAVHYKLYSGKHRGNNVIYDPKKN